MSGERAFRVSKEVMNCVVYNLCSILSSALPPTSCSAAFMVRLRGDGVLARGRGRSVGRRFHKSAPLHVLFARQRTVLRSPPRFNNGRLSPLLRAATRSPRRSPVRARRGHSRSPSCSGWTWTCRSARRSSWHPHASLHSRFKRLVWRREPRGGAPCCCCCFVVGAAR